jgi:threonine dehydrogenase-like Zn-dependent dehydrogenase
VRAITILPGIANSANVQDVAEPPQSDGAVLAETIALGVCGTDHEIVAGNYGEAPEGQERFILGHESLGRVREAPADSGFAAGDHIVGIVRQPDPVPCPACATGEWDMCRNGLYTEHGIKKRNGFGAERFRIAPEFAVKVDSALGMLGVLLEPTSVVAKAWDHCDRVWRLKSAPSRKLLVTGAGPIGLLGALLGAQRGYEIHVYDRNIGGPKPKLVHDLGGVYHSGELHELASLAPDLVMECTGAPPVIASLISTIATDSVICLAGVGAPARREFDIGAFNRTMVLNNGTVFGTVNANRQHYAAAADALARADHGWLARLITRRVPLANFSEALRKQKGDIKVVIDFAQQP